MANMYAQGPRRVAAKIELHPAEIVGLVLQPAIYECFSDIELEKLIFELSTELQGRKENVNTTTTE